jgi:hypothetical protein
LQDALPKSRPKNLLGGDIDFPTERFPKLNQQGQAIKQTVFWPHVDQKVYVTPRTRVPSRHGAKEADVPGSMPGGQPQDFLAFISYVFFNGHLGSYYRPRTSSAPTNPFTS